MKTILVPTDFSESSLQAALYAMELAKHFQASVHLLNVYHLPNPLQTLPLEIIITPDELKSDTDSELKKMASNLKELKHSNINIQLASKNGKSDQEIDHYAKFIHADLIVMGLHGSGKIKEKLIGSTTISVIRNSKTPVLVIPHSVEFKLPDQITFASDGKEIKDQSHLQILFSLVNRFHAEIRIISILSPHDFADKDRIIESLDRSFMNVRHSYYFPENSHINNSIEEFIHSHKTKLLVMLPRRHGFYEKLFSENHVSRLAFHSGIPLLVLHD